MNKNKEIFLAQKMLNEYSEQDSKKVVTLKELDQKVKWPANLFAYSYGIISSLIFGTGLCFALKVIGDSMLIGIVLGCVGILLMCLTYPIYKIIMKSRKNKYRGQIISLSEDILSK